MSPQPVRASTLPVHPGELDRRVLRAHLDVACDLAHRDRARCRCAGAAGRPPRAPRAARRGCGRGSRRSPLRSGSGPRPSAGRARTGAARTRAAVRSGRRTARPGSRASARTAARCSASCSSRNATELCARARHVRHDPDLVRVVRAHLERHPVLARLGAQVDVDLEQPARRRGDPLVERRVRRLARGARERQECRDRQPRATQRTRTQPSSVRQLLSKPRAQRGRYQTRPPGLGSQRAGCTERCPLRAGGERANRTRRVERGAGRVRSTARPAPADPGRDRGRVRRHRHLAPLRDSRVLPRASRRDAEPEHVLGVLSLVFWLLVLVVVLKYLHVRDARRQQRRGRRARAPGARPAPLPRARRASAPSRSWSRSSAPPCSTATG